MYQLIYLSASVLPIPYRPHVELRESRPVGAIAELLHGKRSSCDQNHDAMCLRARFDGRPRRTDERRARRDERSRTADSGEHRM
ncbi:hypothetical protein [Rhodococcus koreensis]